MLKYKESLSIILIMLMFTTFFVILPTNHIKAYNDDTIWVDDDYIYPEYSDGSISKPYKKIQYAINAASNGDTIKVLPGVYEENIIINKSVSITTENYTTTMISSYYKGDYIIKIQSSSVSFEGFTIFDNITTSTRKAVIYISPEAYDVRVINNNLTNSYNGFGILIEGSGDTQNAVINNNTVNRTRGIKITNSNTNSIFKNVVGNFSENPALTIVSSNYIYIENNTFNNCTYGVYISGNSNSLILKNNTIENNVNNGVNLGVGSNHILENNTIRNHGNSGLVLGSPNSIIFNNKITNCSIGINLETISCKIHNNIIKKCRSYGIYTQKNSNSNYIFDNTFLWKPSEYHALDLGDNYWDDTKFTGNYWDDYYGPDNDNDSRGDIPYKKGGVIDNYPLGIFNEFPEISDPQPEHLANGVKRLPTLSVKVEDKESDFLDVYFYVKINNESRIINENPVTVESGGRASVPFLQTAQGKNAVYNYLGLKYDYICVWYAVVHDNYSNTSSIETENTEWIFTTVETPVDNDRPIADAGGPYIIQANDSLKFDGSGCNDSDGTIEFYRWSFGDGESVFNVNSPTHKYLNEGVYTISLVVIDNNGASDIDTTTVVVQSQENDPPDAVAIFPEEATIGKEIDFFGSSSSDPDFGDELSYYWDFGDGDFSDEENPVHIYKKSGKFTVKLTVTDSREESDEIESEITIKPKNEEESPGFEVIIFIFVVTIGLIVLKRKNRNKEI